MAKYYPTGRKRLTVVYRKRRISRLARPSKQRYSISARAMHMPLPSKMCVTLRAVDNNTVSYAALAGYDAFTYPLYFPGLWKDSAGTPSFAGGFLQLIQMYSKAFVRRVRMHTRVMAVANGANVNLNFYTFVCSENNATTLGSITTLAEFQDNSNTYLAKKHYISAYPGGNNYVQEWRTVDVVKYTGIPSINSNYIFASYTNSITTPSAGEAALYPNYVIVAKWPTGTAPLEVAYEHVFDFDIEFQELKNLPQQTSAFPTPSFSRRT